MAERRRVAIACQGGGSHAAFGAGVLKRLLQPDLISRYELVALSGTSGGAMCAALAWAGLRADGPQAAVQRLDAFWGDLKASSLAEAFLNFWGVWAARSPVTAEVSPYAYAPLAEQRLRELVKAHVGVDGLSASQRAEFPVSLLVGATDVLSGERAIFGAGCLTTDHLVASAAIPPLFRAVEIEGRHYWDGLFTSNPPVRELTDPAMTPRKPQEIWVVQINPNLQAEVPRVMSDIVDRRNELTGNLALAQELFFIRKINEIAALMKRQGVPCKYDHIEVKLVEMPPIMRLDYASKLDRAPYLIDELMTEGWNAAEQFMSDACWPGSSTLPVANRCHP